MRPPTTFQYTETICLTECLRVQRLAPLMLIVLPIVVVISQSAIRRVQKRVSLLLEFRLTLVRNLVRFVSMHNP